MTDQIQLDSYVGELRALVERHVQPSYHWYSTHAKYPMLCFRFSAVIVVVGSLLLPTITAARDLPYQHRILVAVSLVVAILTSLSTFYRWDSTWQSRTKTAQWLQSLLANWELALESAKTAVNPREAAFRATEKLFGEAFKSIGSETNQFFTTVKWPEISKPSHG